MNTTTENIGISEQAAAGLETMITINNKPGARL